MGINKKINKYVFLALLLIFLIYWLVSYIQCEQLTKTYGHEFSEAYLNYTMLGDIQYYKVLLYTETTAKVYYVTTDGGSGNILVFQKSELYDGWKFISWETVWSTTGSADGFVWPYLR